MTNRELQQTLGCHVYIRHLYCKCSQLHAHGRMKHMDFMVRRKVFEYHNLVTCAFNPTLYQTCGSLLFVSMYKNCSSYKEKKSTRTVKQRKNGRINIIYRALFKYSTDYEPVLTSCSKCFLCMALTRRGRGLSRSWPSLRFPARAHPLTSAYQS